MIGDTIQIKQNSTAPWATLPDQVSNAVTLAKVNQDSFGAEYRFRGAAGRYILRIRNTVEPATATRGAVNRHNCELTYIRNADPENGVPVEETYITYWIARFPPGGSQDLMEAIFYAATVSLSEAQFGKILNFES